MHSTVEPVREFLLKVLKIEIPGTEFVTTVIIILIFGFMVVSLGKFKSNIPGVSHFFGLTKMISGISHKIETGKIKVILMDENGSHFLAFTTSVIEIIDEKRFVIVFRPFTPNITSGFTYLVPENDFKNLPSLLGKRALKILFHGWLSRTKS